MLKMGSVYAKSGIDIARFDASVLGFSEKSLIFNAMMLSA